MTDTPAPTSPSEADAKDTVQHQVGPAGSPTSNVALPGGEPPEPERSELEQVESIAAEDTPQPAADAETSADGAAGLDVASTEAGDIAAVDEPDRSTAPQAQQAGSALAAPAAQPFGDEPRPPRIPTPARPVEATLPEGSSESPGETTDSASPGVGAAVVPDPVTSEATTTALPVASGEVDAEAVTRAMPAILDDADADVRDADDRDAEVLDDVTGTEEGADVGRAASTPRTAPAPARGRILGPVLGTSRAGLLIGLLVGLLGFALVVQVQNYTSTSGLASARQEDLVRILDDLSSREERLRRQIASLEAARARLTTTGDRNSAALAEARTRSTALGILAGTVAAQGPGITLTMTDPRRGLTGEDMLDAVEELRAAGAEALQVGPVRVGLDSAFTDSDGQIVADGRTLAPPYVILAIGDPATLATALDIPGGVVDTVRRAGGKASARQQDRLVIRALRALSTAQYAQPAAGGR